MKVILASLLLTLCLFTSISKADDSALQTALNESLKSTAVATIRNSFQNYELTQAQIAKLQTSSFEVKLYDIQLFYSAQGTAGGCFIKALAEQTYQEYVVPGYDGFQRREVWHVSATPGPCPR